PEEPRRPAADRGQPAGAGAQPAGAAPGGGDREAEPRRRPGAGGGQQVRPKTRETTGTAIAHTDAIGLSDLLVRLLEYRDATFHAGSSLTRLLAVSIGRELELDRIHLEALALAALLSDLGGLGLGLNGYHLADLENPEERRKAEQREVAVSLQLLHGITLPAGVHEAVRHQHERWDGKGYPDGLREEEIPYGARVIAIARAAADYLTRANEAGGVAGALDELQRNAGSRYDPVVVSVLRRVFQRRADHGVGFGLGGRIIVVHPEELRALGVATQLHAEGYVSELVRDVSKARESIRRTGPKAIVFGAGIPQDDLSRLIRDIRANPEVAPIPLIAIDANDMDLRVALLTAGADVCFAGEVTFREFKATLDALLRRREEIDRPQDRLGRVEARL
ncbi:MAG TPA: HD domain-containing phosphohydrolase, partial [Longimicrobiaceae bacterium]|nr:HD domain-containing phosphohydrolase [Longimicrobiaceae bacterium]